MHREEKYTLPNKNKKLDFLNLLIQKLITRLDYISSLSVMSVNKKYVKCEENISRKISSKSSMEDEEVTNECAFEIIKDVKLLKEEVNDLSMQISILEEIYLILHEGLTLD